MRRSAVGRRSRTRPVVALAVLTAWLATIVVTGSAASAADTGGAAPSPAAIDTAPTPDPSPSDSPSPDPSPSDSPAPAASMSPSPDASPAADASPTAASPAAEASPSADPSPSSDVSPSPDPAPSVSPSLTAPPAPAAPTLSGPTTGTVGTTATYTVTPGAGALPGDVQECAVVTPGGSPGYDTCPTSWTPFANATTGDYALYVRTVRTGATTATADPVRVTLDATAPVIDSINLVLNRSADSPRWRALVAPESGLIVACTIAGAGDWCDATSKDALPAEGVYTLTVTAEDRYGNRTTNSLTTYTYDVTGPSAPVVTALPTWTTTSSVTWTIDKKDAARVVCTITGPATEVTRDNCGSTTTVSPAADGLWSLTAVGYDQADNPSTASSTVSTTVDTRTPVITINRSLDTPPVQPVWRVRVDSDATATCSLIDTTGTASDPIDCGESYAADLQNQPGGTYTLHVVARDAAGHQATLEDRYTIAPATPRVTITSPGASQSPTWLISAQGDAQLTCTLTSPDGTTTSPACSGPSVTTPLTKTDGFWTLDVVATVDGAASPAATAGYELDTTAPGDPSLGGSTGPQNTPGITWTIGRGAGTVSVTCTVTHDGITTTDSTTACGSTLRPVVADDATGSWRLTATAYDRVGNPSATVSRTVVYDLSPPAAPAVTRTSASPTRDRATTWTLGTAESGSTFWCSWTGPDGYSTTPVACAASYAASVPDVHGTYTLHVYVVDAAGNRGPEQTGSVYYDVESPKLTFVTPPTGPSNVQRVTWNTTVDETSTKTECRLIRVENGGDVQIHDWRLCDRSSIEDLPRVDGTYVLQVRDTDLVGNVDPAGTSSPGYQLDTTGPGAPTVSGPSGDSKVPAVDWTITPAEKDPGVAYECRLVTGGSADAWTACDTDGTAGNGIHYTGTLSDGTYVLEVVALDDLRNPSAPVTISGELRLDTKAPAAAQFAPTTTIGRDQNHRWAWSGETGATATCQLYSGATADLLSAVGPVRGCTSPHDEVLPTPTTGTYYALHVTLTDAARNTTSATSPTYFLDTVAPKQPAVGGTSGEGSSQAASYTITPDEVGTTSTCTLYSRTVAGTAWTAVAVASTCATTTWSLALPKADAVYRIGVTSTDAAKNVSTEGFGPEYHLDVTGPDAPVFTAYPKDRANAASVAWTWTFEPLSTSSCTLTYEGTVVDGPKLCNSGSFATTLTSGDGTYTLTVDLTDRYGTVGGSATSVGYVLDTTPPAAPTVNSDLPKTANTPSGTYSIVGPQETYTAECQLRRDGFVVSVWGTCTFPKTVGFSGDGSYVLDVRLTDPYKNTGAEGHSLPYLLDTSLPTAPSITVPASPSSNEAPVFGITIDGDTTATCELRRGSTSAGLATACSTSYTGSLSSDGDYVLVVVAKDAAGNTSTGTSTPYTFDTTPPTAPTVTGPAGPSQNKNPVFTWSGEPGATAECAAAKDGGAAAGWVACSTPYASPLSDDGTWVLSVRLSDAARNVGPAGTSGGYVLDTTAPATPVVSAPQSPGRNLSPSWSAVSEAGSTTECRFTGQLDFTACTLPLTTPVGTDGEYVLAVRSTDVAGNVSAIGTGAYVLDTTAPPAPVVTQPSGPGRSRTPSIAFTTETGSTGSCRLTRGSAVVGETGPCVSPASLDLAGLPDGAYTLTVRAVDAAGNTGPAATGTYVLDTTAPAAPVLTLVPGSPSSDRGPVYAFNIESGAVPACRLTTPAGAVKELSCTSPLTIDLSGSADGSYVLAVTAKDAAGNVSAAASSTYALDSNAPAAPRLTGPATPGTTRTPSWKVLSSAPAECRLVRGLTVLKDWAACTSSYTADLYGQPDGVYLLEARVAGSTAASTSRYRLDSAGPAVAVLTAPPSPSTVLRPVWAIASPEASVTAECRVTVFGQVLQDWLPCPVSSAGSLFTADELTRGDGTYTLHVRLTDAAGNIGTTIATSDYVLDTSAPAAVGVVGPESPGRLATPTWTITSGAGVTLECRLSEGSAVVKPWAPCKDTYTADLTGLADGTYTLTVHALSAAGTPGPDTTSLYEYDTSAAEKPTALTVDPVGPSQNRAPRWTFVLPPGSTAVCKVTLGDKVISDGPCDSGYVMDLSNAADGSYTMSVRAVDKAGNQSAAVAKGYVLRTVPPSAPVFTMAPGGPSSTTDPRWAFSIGRNAKAQCRILYAGAVTEDWVVCTSPYTLFLTGRPDGRYMLQVRSVDDARNTSKVVESSYDFDRTAGALALFVDTPVSPSNDPTPTWVVSAARTTAPALLRAAALTTGGAATECRWTGTSGAGAWAPCSGSYTGTTNGDGRYQLDVRTASDSTTAAGPASTSWYQLDTGRPAPPVLTAGQVPVGNEAEVSWSWAEDPDLLAECRLLKGDSPLGPYATCTSPYTASLGRSGQGSYTAQVRLTDLAGNPSDPAPGTYRYDTTPPPQPFFTSRPPARGMAGSATWTFASLDDATARCGVTHDGVVTESACAGEFRLGPLREPGTWTLSVHYVDTAGNVGRPVVGSYTLTTPALVRDRVDGPTNGETGGSPFIPRPPRPDSGFGSPDVPAAPVPAGVPPQVPPLGADEPDHPKLDAIARAAEPVRRAAGQLARALGLPRLPPGVPEGTRVPDAIKNVLNSTITRPQLPLALLFVVVLFLLVQNRIDRRDPKLAAAPVTAEPELSFGPRVRSLQTGGATA
jgi:hypothetical protein